MKILCSTNKTFQYHPPPPQKKKKKKKKKKVEVSVYLEITKK